MTLMVRVPYNKGEPSFLTTPRAPILHGYRREVVAIAALKNRRPRNRWCVVGAGAGGQALAGCLALRRQRVTLLNRSPENIEIISQQGGIKVTGELKGFGRLKVATTDPARALEGVKVIMVAVPATGHRWVAAQLAPHLRPNQIVVLNPGRTGGALEFRNTLYRLGVNGVVVAEASTLLVASRLAGPGHVHIHGFKKQVPVASIPAWETARTCTALRRAFPGVVRAESVLETSLGNIGAIFHPIPTLFNAARIESGDGPFDYYRQGVTRSVARVMLSVDRERLNVARALGLELPDLLGWMGQIYGVYRDDLMTALRDNPAYQGIKAPATVEHRYLLEDVPMGLVPMAHMGEILGVPTPCMRQVVEGASLLLGVDLWRQGRDPMNMGIQGLTSQEIVNLAYTGYREELVV